MVLSYRVQENTYNMTFIFNFISLTNGTIKFLRLWESLVQYISLFRYKVDDFLGEIH